MSDNGLGGVGGWQLRTPALSLPQIPDSIRNPAKWTHERLVKSIIKFEEKLSDGEEIGLRLVNFGGDEIIHIDDVGYWGPDIVIFYGTNREGHAVELLQHVTQVSVLLVAVQKEKDQPRRIGFDLQRSLDEPADKTE